MSKEALDFLKQFNTNITAYDVVVGVKRSSTEFKFIEIPDELREEYFNLFKKFVIKGSRAERRTRISNSTYNTIKECGILLRLLINPDRKEDVEYSCGQDWDSEMKILREVFAGDLR